MNCLLCCPPAVMLKLLAGLQDEAGILKGAAGKGKKSKKTPAAAADDDGCGDDGPAEVPSASPADDSTKLQVTAKSRSGRAVRHNVRHGPPTSVSLQFAAREQLQQYQAAATAGEGDPAAAAAAAGTAGGTRPRRQCASNVVYDGDGDVDDSGVDADYQTSAELADSEPYDVVADSQDCGDL
jgi:hypothetical protein